MGRRQILDNIANAVIDLIKKDAPVNKVAADIPPNGLLNRPGYVYKTVNTVDGTKYIGSKLSREGHKGKFFDENYYGSGVDLKKAIAEHGKDKFINVKEIDTRTVKGLKDAEQGLLNKVGARQDPTYYNKHNHYAGGSEGSGAKKGQIAWNKGKPTSAEQKAKLKDSSAKRWAKDSERAKMSKAQEGRVATDKTKKQMSDSHISKNTSNPNEMNSISLTRNNTYSARVKLYGEIINKNFKTLDEAKSWRSSMIDEMQKGLL